MFKPGFRQGVLKFIVLRLELHDVQNFICMVRNTLLFHLLFSQMVFSVDAFELVDRALFSNEFEQAFSSYICWWSPMIARIILHKNWAGFSAHINLIVPCSINWVHYVLDKKAACKCCIAISIRQIQHSEGRLLLDYVKLWKRRDNSSDI